MNYESAYRFVISLSELSLFIPVVKMLSWEHLFKAHCALGVSRVAKAVHNNTRERERKFKKKNSTQPENIDEENGRKQPYMGNCFEFYNKCGWKRDEKNLSTV